GTGEKPPQASVVGSRLQLEICMTEGIYHQVSDEPSGNPEKIHAPERIHDCQGSKQPQIENQLLGQRERDGRERAVQTALVMLSVNPVQSAQMKSAMRCIMPNLGANRCGNER